MAVALSAAYGAAAGTTVPALQIQQDSRDDSLMIYGGVGTAAWTTGIYMTITLGGNYSQTTYGSGPLPRFQVTFIGLPAQTFGLYVSTITTNSIVISARVAPTGTLAATLAAGVVIVVSMDP